MKRALIEAPLSPFKGVPLMQDTMMSEDADSVHLFDINTMNATAKQLKQLLSASIDFAKRRRLDGGGDEEGPCDMDITYQHDEHASASEDENMSMEFKSRTSQQIQQVQHQQQHGNTNNLLDLPTEMLAHILSFLPLPDLCRSAAICSSTYAVVRFYTLSVVLQFKCKEFMDKNEKLVKDLIFAQNEHIEVLQKLVEFYRGGVPIPPLEVNKLQQRQLELHQTERTLKAQRDGIQKNITFYSDQYKASLEVKQSICLSHSGVS